jgi:hypothetical protein
MTLTQPHKKCSDRHVLESRAWQLRIMRSHELVDEEMATNKHQKAAHVDIFTEGGVGAGRIFTERTVDVNCDERWSWSWIEFLRKLFSGLRCGKAAKLNHSQYYDR